MLVFMTVQAEAIEKLLSQWYYCVYLLIQHILLEGNGSNGLAIFGLVLKWDYDIG
jgi:hypothetical protein